MISRLTTLLLTFLLVSSAFAQFPIGNYSHVYFFGDSLSDAGNFGTPNPSPPCGAEYAPETDICSPNNDPVLCGKVWAQYFAEAMGITVTPSKLGGDDFSFLGAQMVGKNIDPPFVNSPSVVFANGGPQGTQINNFLGFLGVQKISPFDLTVIWGGSNDLLGFLLAHISNPDQIRTLAPKFIAGDTNSFSVGIKQLIDQGASNFLIVSIPDLSLTPEIQGLHSPFFTEVTHELSQAYFLQQKAILKNLAAAYHVNIYFEDTFDLLAFTINKFSALGFSFNNQTNWCSSNPNSNPSQFVFFNGIHPSSHAHFLLAQDMLNCGGNNPVTGQPSFCQKV